MYRLLYCLLVVLVTAPVAQASILGDFLTFDGKRDDINDESRTDFRDPGADGFGVGDVIFGIATISDIDRSGSGNIGLPANQQLTIVYSAEVASGSGTFASPFNMKATTVAGLTLADLLHDSVEGDGIDARSIFVALGNTKLSNADDPLNFNEATPEAELLLMDAASGWAFEMEGGIAAASDDYLDAVLLPSGGPLPIVIQDGGFTIFDDVLSPLGVGFLQVPSPNGGFHDVVLSLATASATSDDPWDFQDDASYHINATPEPQSLAIFAGLFAVPFGRSLLRRRRKREKRSNQSAT